MNIYVTHPLADGTLFKNSDNYFHVIVDDLCSCCDINFVQNHVNVVNVLLLPLVLICN